MARTTAEAVEAIVEVLSSAPDVSPFIETASALVDSVLSDSGLGDDLLELIERWLAAHLYCVRVPRPASQGAGGASVSYQGATGMRLDATLYGQTAIALDPTGRLAEIGTRKGGAALWWLGKDD